MIKSKDWNLQLGFKLQDCWIGVYWQREGNCLDLWICLLPMLPIHFSCWGERWGMKEPSLEKICNLCGHNLENNRHGFDQNDAWMEGDVLKHSGRCTYCRECNPVLFQMKANQ